MNRERGNGAFLAEQNRVFAGTGIISEWARKGWETRRARAAQICLDLDGAALASARRDLLALLQQRQRQG